MKRIATHFLALTALLVTQAFPQQSTRLRMPASGTGNITSAGTITSSTMLASECANCFLVASSGGNMAWVTPTDLTEQRKPIIPAPKLELVKASAKPVAAGQLARPSYLTLAHRIKLDSAGTDEARMLDAIHSLELKVYDFDLVDKYLYNAALKQGTNVRWVWKPMRQADLDIAAKAPLSGWQPAPGMGLVSQKVYAKAIPERVLERAADILEHLSEVVLLVSDYEVMRPDPFLAISTAKLLAENKIWIVDVWDEPGFTEPPDPHKLVTSLR